MQFLHSKFFNTNKTICRFLEIIFFFFCWCLPVLVLKLLQFWVHHQMYREPNLDLRLLLNLVAPWKNEKIEKWKKQIESSKTCLGQLFLSLKKRSHQSFSARFSCVRCEMPDDAKAVAIRHEIIVNHGRCATRLPIWPNPAARVWWTVLLHLCRNSSKKFDICGKESDETNAFL